MVLIRHLSLHAVTGTSHWDIVCILARINSHWTQTHNGRRQGKNFYSMECPIMLELPRREARRSLHFLVHILMDYSMCLLLYYNYLFKQFYTYTIYYLVSLSSYRSSPIWKCKKRPWVCTPQNTLFYLLENKKYPLFCFASSIFYGSMIWQSFLFLLHNTTNGRVRSHPKCT